MGTTAELPVPALGARTRRYTGASTLLRFVVHRDRARMAAWVIGIAVLTLVSAASVKGLYPTQADLDAAAAATKGNAAAIAFNGPAVGLDTIGGQVAFNLGAFGLVVMGLMSLLMVGRLTRGEEEAGRLEMLRALPVGSRAPTVAALLSVAGMDLLAGAAVTASLLAEGLSIGGSIVFGTSFVLVGLFFGAVAMAAAEITENTRVVYGATGVVLAAAFVLRAVGDIGDGTISWLSPLGWAQKSRPFAGDRWWPFAVLVAATVAVAAGAVRLAARRDLGAGLVAPRPGRPNAGRRLAGPFGLAVRLQRGAFAGWALAVLVMAAAYGSIAPTVDDFIGRNKALADVLAAGKGSLTDAYFATSFQVLALFAAGYTIQSALRLRTEEAAWRAEPVLATPVSRWAWGLSHLAISFGGTLVLLGASGLTVGISYAAAGGRLAAVPRLLASSLVYAPAVWVVTGLAVALLGLFPRATIVAWLGLTACLVVSMFGRLLRLSHWVLDLSPFEHIPRLPAAGVRPVPLILLALLSAGLGTAGLVGLRRRDLG